MQFTTCDVHALMKQGRRYVLVEHVERQALPTTLCPVTADGVPLVHYLGRKSAAEIENTRYPCDEEGGCCCRYQPILRQGPDA